MSGPPSSIPSELLPSSDGVPPGASPTLSIASLPTNPPAIDTPTTPVLASSTVTSTNSASATSTNSSSSSSSSSGGGLDTGKLVAILVPVILVVALVPIIYILYLRRRAKNLRRESTPDLRIPPETTLLNKSGGSRKNSISLPSPFSDSERIRSGSLGIYDSPLFSRPLSEKPTMSERPLSGRPSSELERAPSPTLPSPSVPTFRTQEAWPLPSTDKAMPALPAAAAANNSNNLLFPSLRPSSSQYAPTPQTAGFEEAPHAITSPSGNNASSTANPFRQRDSDAISQLSFDPNDHRLQSSRDADEVSVVSAMSPDDTDDRNFSRLS